MPSAPDLEHLAIDPDGDVQLADRARDVIKSAAERISSIDLENAAIAHPAVQEAVIIGVALPRWRERPVLVAARDCAISCAP